MSRIAQNRINQNYSVSHIDSFSTKKSRYQRMSGRCKISRLAHANVILKDWTRFLLDRGPISIVSKENR